MSEQQDPIEYYDEWPGMEDLDDVDGELLLIAMAADTGGPVVEMDLAALTPEDKRLVLELLRRRLGACGRGEGTEREAA